MKKRLITGGLFLIGACAAVAADVGAVYTMTNDPAGNAVVVFGRAVDGTLTKSGTFPTGGTSIGFFATDNQNGLLLNEGATCLWAVNSLSNTISAFQVSGTSLSRVGVIGSGGVGPVSLTVNEGLGVLYVLNNGNLLAGTASPPAPSPDSISGFTVGANCGLTALPGSTYSLSQTTGTGPAEVGFNPTGTVIVVTEKLTNKIDTWIVGATGLLSGMKMTPSVAHEPIGFAFDNRGQLLVTQADCHNPTPPGVVPGCSVGPAPAPFDTPTLTSYTVASDGTLTVADSFVDNQAANCWVVITNSQRFAFTTNPLGFQPGGSVNPAGGLPPAGSITTFGLKPDGKLTKIGVTDIPTVLNGINAGDANTFLGITIDPALSRNSRFLYVLSELDGTINEYRVGLDGTLTHLGVVDVTNGNPVFNMLPFPNGLVAQ